MKHQEKQATNRNWALVFISSILIVVGLALVVLAIGYATSLGWWALLIGISGLGTIAAAVMSIIKNDPSWILLSLVIPG